MKSFLDELFTWSINQVLVECRIVVVSLKHEVGGTSEAFAQWHANVFRQDFAFRTNSLKAKFITDFSTDLK